MWRPFRTLHTIRCNNLAGLRTAGDTWRQVLPLPTPPLPRLEAPARIFPRTVVARLASAIQNPTMPPTMGHDGASMAFVRNYRWIIRPHPNGLGNDAQSMPASTAERPKFDATESGPARGARGMMQCVSTMKRSETRAYCALRSLKLKSLHCDMK
jgi:hypothetical protein